MAETNAEATVFDEVRTLAAEHLDKDLREITPESTFKDLGADSLDIVELVMVLEEKFGIEIPDEDTEGITTIGQIVAYIEERVAQKATA